MSDFNHIPAVLREIERRTEEVVERSAKRTQKRIVEGMHEPKSGRMYGSHQASAPGESPATDTGVLERSIVIDAPAAHERVLGVNDPKAQHLEFGTRKMAPRPFVQPAAEAEKPEMAQDARDAMQGLGQ